ncbi:hypothetical protein PROFUN_03370 [Planoprotostelium fungivorum]|uniref:Transmembrane protein n=1 Tax=Planoprotostelium fungivorum TaxID=1890364 RepID=A0A2P6NWC9_9EUKA|nr:hypothetical protein PROFUN_03370 [Planoprotostelium fungivorum]
MRFAASFYGPNCGSDMQPEVHSTFSAGSWLLTLIGGVRMRDGFGLPQLLAINFLWIMPGLLGLTMVLTVANTSVDHWVYQIALGGTQGLMSLAIQLNASRVRQKNKDRVGDAESVIEYQGGFWNYLTPRPLWAQCTSSLLSGGLIGLSIGFLSLDNITSTGQFGTYVLCALGWVTFVMDEFSRVIFTAIIPFIFAFQGLSSQILAGNLAAHIVFVCTPLMWAFGFIPQITRFSLWTASQALYLLLAGPKVSNQKRLSLVLAFSVICLYLFADVYVAVGFAAGTGYFLSRDVYAPDEEKRVSLLNVLKLQVSKRMIFDGAFGGAVGAISASLAYAGQKSHYDVGGSLTTVSITTGVWLLMRICSTLQRTRYLRTLYNPLVSRNQRGEYTHKLSLGIFGVIHYWTWNIAPLIAIVHVSVFGLDVLSNQTNWGFQSLLIARNYRYIWQGGPDAILMVSAAGWWILYGPSESSGLDYQVSLFVANIIYDRYFLLKDNLVFYVSSVASLVVSFMN